MIDRGKRSKTMSEVKQVKNISKEQNKKIFLMGNFNIDLLSFDTSQHINEFIDNTTSSSLQPQISQPTRIHKNHKTLIDNIFCNIPNFEIKTSVSGNITTTLSDHLPQLFLISDFFSNSPPSKYNIMTHDWKNFNSQEFLEDFNKTNWDKNLQLNKSSVIVSFNNYLDTINTSITKHAPIRKLNKTQEISSETMANQGYSKLNTKEKFKKRNLIYRM